MYQNKKLHASFYPLTLFKATRLQIYPYFHENLEGGGTDRQTDFAIVNQLFGLLIGQ
jgi:hypothetical protein